MRMVTGSCRQWDKRPSKVQQAHMSQPRRSAHSNSSSERGLQPCHQPRQRVTCPRGWQASQGSNDPDKPDSSALCSKASTALHWQSRRGTCIGYRGPRLLSPYHSCEGAVIGQNLHFSHGHCPAIIFGGSKWFTKHGVMGALSRMTSRPSDCCLRTGPMVQRSLYIVQIKA